MPRFNLETFSPATGDKITGYTDVEADDIDDACAVLRAELASYPEYMRLAPDEWDVRPAGTTS